jgi:hypothetical protein
MTVEEEFEKWWTQQVRCGFDVPDSQKHAAMTGYIAATKRTAERCAEICDGPRTLTCFDCAETIKEEFGL